MKPFGLINIGVLPLLLEAMAPAYAQHDQREQDARRPNQEQKTRPEKSPRREKPLGQEQQPRARRHEERKQEAQPERSAIRPSAQEPRGHQAEHRAVWPGRRAQDWRSEHRTWQERGGYNGYRIPEDRYRSHFGPRHPFRIQSYPVVVLGGYPRFQFGGFWFSIVDPWPEYWADAWYEHDDVYIDYAGDGYYLYNRRHPGDRITISVHVN